MIKIVKIDPNDFVHSFNKTYKFFDPNSSKTFLIDAIQKIKTEIHSNHSNYSDDEKNALIIAGIFFRGILDYLTIKTIIQSPDWLNSSKSLEVLWTLICDCEERLSFQTNLHGPLIYEIHSSIFKIKTHIKENYGPGIYASPEFKCKRSLCSLCGQNIKKCDHIPGQLYGGRWCNEIPEDIELLGVSLVTNPEDNRCRIWPWNMDEKDNTAQMAIFTNFQLDDFLSDDDWLKKIM